MKHKIDKHSPIITLVLTEWEFKQLYEKMSLGVIIGPLGDELHAIAKELEAMR